jgi:hypothetical protein
LTTFSFLPSSLFPQRQQPFTGVIYLKGGVDGKNQEDTSDFGKWLKGKKIGYVGEFGKIQVRFPVSLLLPFR